jgi:deazaflavin-dependent oxidoreductase (nitroreductase family)
MPVDTATMNWNDALIADFRANEGRITVGPMTGASLVLLTTTGARSGLPRTTPLAYTRDGERYVVVGSNSGEPTHPAWLANLQANPEVFVEVGAEAFRAHAVVTSGAERRRLFEAHAVVLPGFAAYQKKTDRELAVVILERIAGA